MIRVFRDLRQSLTNLSQVSPSSLDTATYGIAGTVTDGVNVTGNGTGAAPYLSIGAGGQYTLTAPISGHKYYIRCKAKVTNAVCATIKMQYGGVNQIMVTSPAINTVYDVSAVITATATTQNVYFYEYYADAATANGKVLEVHNFEIIDLTVDYGTGIEPLVAVVDATLTANAITYFTGTYSFNLNDFTTNGDKVIQPIKCAEIKQDNEDWRIEMEADLSYQPYLIQDYLLIVTTKTGEQPFRIKNISVDSSKVSLTARHVGYDLENYVCEFIFGYSYTNGTLGHLRLALDLAIPQPPFTYGSDNVLSGRVFFKESTALGNINEIVATLGGHIVMNWWDIRIDSTIGADNQVSVEYGKNLQGAKISNDWNSVCTSLVPVGNNNILLSGNTNFDLTTDVLYATGVTYDRPYARKVVFQTDSVTELTTLGNAYLEANKYPKLNYTVQADTIQDVALGDTISVKARQFTILTNVLGYTFNVLTQKIVNIEFGNFRKDARSVFSNITGSIADLRKQMIQENIQMNSAVNPAWTALTPLNGWTEVAGNPLLGRRKADGSVEIRGQLTGGTRTDGTIVTNLPAELRNTYWGYSVQATSTPVIYTSYCGTDGNLKIRGATSGDLVFTITFV